jgi:hypothetical protein
MEKAMPSDVEAPNATTVAAMHEARIDKLPAFRNVSVLMADLNADD